MKRRLFLTLLQFITISFILTMLVSNTACTPNADLRFHPMDEDIKLDHTYIMKQKFWTLHDEFIIRSDNQKPLFHIKGKLFSIGDKLSFRDMNGQELAYISEQVISLLKRYRIYKADGSFAVIRKDLTLFNDKFTIKVDNEKTYLVKGNFWDLEYSFYRQGRLVGIVSKKLVSLNDTYTIQLARGEDDVLLLASAVVIDMIKSDEESSGGRRHGHRRRRR